MVHRTNSNIFKCPNWDKNNLILSIQCKDIIYRKYIRRSFMLVNHIEIFGRL